MTKAPRKPPKAASGAVSDQSMMLAAAHHTIDEQALTIETMQELLQRRTQEAYDAELARKRAERERDRYKAEVERLSPPPEGQATMDATPAGELARLPPEPEQ